MVSSLFVFKKALVLSKKTNNSIKFKYFQAYRVRTLIGYGKERLITVMLINRQTLGEEKIWKFIWKTIFFFNFLINPWFFYKHCAPFYHLTPKNKEFSFKNSLHLSPNDGWKRDSLKKITRMLVKVLEVCEMREITEIIMNLPWRISREL